MNVAKSGQMAIWISAAAALATASAAPSADYDQCMRKAQTQADMADCANARGGTADQELNKVYQDVLRKHAKDTAFVAKLKAAQRAWIAYRDAELAARFPAADNSAAYGSSYPMCADTALEAMARQRTEELRQWLEGAQEGDVCAGSYRVGD